MASTIHLLEKIVWQNMKRKMDKLSSFRVSIVDCLVQVAMKTCVLFNTINHRQENKAKIKLKHQNPTS
jgi:hypothetical protein